MDDWATDSALTSFPDLNAFLAVFVAGARIALPENFVGAYLIGSFAMGDAHEHSDVDFLVVTDRPLTAPELAQIQALHRRLYEMPVAWAKHLEGSYVPTALLRSVDPKREPLFYLDNGASELIWDRHCNTTWTRWVLRHHGRVLAGPGPAQVVEPVDPDELRSEAVSTIQETALWAREMERQRRTGDAIAFSRWAQPYLVLSLCRMLYTVKMGDVLSKRDAAKWALAELDAQWHELIAQAVQDRPNPWVRAIQPATVEAIAATMRFTDFALTRVAVRNDAKA